MGIFCTAQETQRGALYQPGGVGWGERWEGVSRWRGHKYTYGWFMLSFDKATKFCKVIIFWLKTNLKNNWFKSK